MTTTQQSQSGKSLTEMSSLGQSVNAQTDAVDVRSIRSIQLSDGWHNIDNCQFVHFAVGEAHSPITPSKLYPSLRYDNEYGQNVRTPLSKILSFSEDQSNSGS